MSIAGNWTLFYSFGCSGTYSQAPITFNANGTFSIQGLTGQWTVAGGDVLFVYEPAPSAVYSGNVSGGAMTGIMTNYKIGAQGCWYATTAKIPPASATEKKVHDAETLDSSGAVKK